MTIQSIALPHVNALHTAAHVHELFGMLGYSVETPEPFEGADLERLISTRWIVRTSRGHTLWRG